MATSLFANPLVVTETSKQITKALKCVAFTNMQVGDMMMRKHERLEKRIRSVSEEIELLRADVTENVATRRERRQQLADIEEDVERAEVLGNALMVEELLAELCVLQEEGRREDALYRSLRKALRSRKRVKKAFIREKHAVEDEMRSFNRKQNLIQALLTTFAKDSAARAGKDRASWSNASQSDCGSDRNDDGLVSPAEEDDSVKSEPSFSHRRRVYNPEPARPRRWSADGTYPQTPPKLKTRARRALSLTLSSRPHSLGSVEEESDDCDEEEGDDVETGRPTAASMAADAAVPVQPEPAARQHALLLNRTSAAELLLEEIHDEQDNFYSHSGESSDDHESDSEDDHFSASLRRSRSSTVAASEAASGATEDENESEACAERKLSLCETESPSVPTTPAKTSCDQVEVALVPMEQQEATVAVPTAAA
ncbi:hypothetical protein PybrP1_002269 [[Pythium] brassicae (nom. inval.)]|nr:hypothetical protein PybrP1_002269 [[Pythium] brassicae (nom. inval.)]